MQILQAIDDTQRRRRIGAASGKAGLRRNVFLQRACIVAPNTVTPLHRANRLYNRIFFINRQIGAIQRHRQMIVGDNFQNVIKIDRRHDHAQLVVAIRPRRQDVQT